jgi:transcriptional regulator GlxA family with amidase domain
MKPKRIGLLGFDQVAALHLVGAADAFASACLDDGYGGRIRCYDVHVVGVTSDRFQSECGLTFQAESTLSHTPSFDTVIIAGGIGIRNGAVAEKIAAWLLKRIDWRRIGAVGSGIYGLASTGLLNGRSATTHPRFAADVAQRFPQIRLDQKRSLVQDDAYYTSSGLSAGLHLALAMIAEDYGPSVSASVERELSLPLNGKDGGPAEVPQAQSDNYPIDRFADLVGWILRNLHADLSLEVLARRACMCPNRFGKVFKSIFGEAPGEFVAKLRLNEARRRLTCRRKAIRTVAASVGFADPAAFQRAFKRRFGVQPAGVQRDSPQPKTVGLLHEQD